MTLKEILCWVFQFLKAKPMPDKDPLTQPPPLNWGDDILSEFINSTLNNVFTTFVNSKSLYLFLADVDRIFFTACDNLKNVNPVTAHQKSTNIHHTTAKMIAVRTLMVRAHSGYRAACQLAMQGQIAESFPVLRVCLEYSLYALHIEKKPPRVEGVGRTR